MAHQALARKYRPRRFSEVATQEHVSQTLRHAIQTGRVAQAYLFCGPRGVGKTTLARVLAMGLNCPQRTEEGEPCGTCESCTRIWSGYTALDVVEIDAASNRGVDDARELRERAMYAPSEEDRYKVYIVDEAHMLTVAAWNALLKVIEEPPPRVIFVFATTEPQKIQQAAAPILSRCQRFDFRRIGVTDIVDRLREVLEREGAEAPDEALRTLAKKADGGMRDALSLLDQVLALTGGEIDQVSVRRVLGLVEDERFLELFDILADARHGAVFGFVEELLDEGYDLSEFYYGLVDALRTLLRISLSGVEEVTELRPDLRDAFAERAGRFGPGDLVRMLAMASELESSGSLRRSAQPRMLLEMLLLRLSYLDRTVELDELIRSLGGASTGEPAGRAGGDGSGEGPAGPAATRVSEDGAGAVEGGAPTLGLASSASGPGTEPESARREGESRTGSGAPDSSAVSAPASGADDLLAAWRRLVGRGGALPPGFSPLLRAGRVRSPGPGELELLLPAGPLVERLEEPTVLRTVEEAVAQEVGRSVSITVRGVVDEDTDPHGRITRESVRKGRLRELMEREPLLEQAVEELDLELLE